MERANTPTEKEEDTHSTILPPPPLSTHHGNPSTPPPQKKTITRITDLQRMTIDELAQYAKHLGIKNLGALSKSQVVFEVVKTISAMEQETLVGEGVLEILPDGFGFLRSPNYNYFPSAEDIYVSPAQIRRFNLKKGDTIYGSIRPPKDKEKYFALLKVDQLNYKSPETARDRIAFENLTPVFPTERLILETNKEKLSTRVMDLLTPIAKGTRGLIVSPPKSGKTSLLINIIQAVEQNYPEVYVIVLLIDERPEEVTGLMRSVMRAEVVASTFDEPPDHHTHVAEMVIEKARRLAEGGTDVVIFLDSLTRLARAYNTVQPHSGKILTGGVDAHSLYKPKRFFGSARKLEQGGSLTIIASALTDTGSRMDEVIFEEFKATGNMELVLDRKLAERRLYPAIDPLRSSTRKEELLLHPEELEKIYEFRRALADLSATDAMGIFLGRLRKTNSNAEFLLRLKDLKD